MKYSEELQLRLKGVKSEEIKAMKEQEALEAAEAAKKDLEEKKEKEAEEKTALESALEMVKDLENKLQAKEDELTKLNQEFANINNKQTIKEKPDKTSGADVMKQLFNSKKED